MSKSTGSVSLQCTSLRITVNPLSSPRLTPSSWRHTRTQHNHAARSVERRAAAGLALATIGQDNCALQRQKTSPKSSSPTYFSRSLALRAALAPFLRQCNSAPQFDIKDGRSDSSNDYCSLDHFSNSQSLVSEAAWSSKNGGGPTRASVGSVGTE